MDTLHEHVCKLARQIHTQHQARIKVAELPHEAYQVLQQWARLEVIKFLMRNLQVDLATAEKILNTEIIGN